MIMMKFQKDSIYVGDRFVWPAINRMLEVSHVQAVGENTRLVFLAVGEDNKLTGAPYFIDYEEFLTLGMLKIDHAFITQLRERMRQVCPTKGCTNLKDAASIYCEECREGMHYDQG